MNCVPGTAAAAPGLDSHSSADVSVIHAATPEAAQARAVAPDASRRTEYFRSPGVSSPSSDRERSPGATILIAEDHEDSRDALRTLLEAFDYRVEIATNGREAVDRALATHPDLVVMDVMMPEVDGLEATRALRASAGFHQVPILALTAMEGAREQVLAAGCDDYVPKPIDVRAFLSKVEHWTRSGRAA